MRLDWLIIIAMIVMVVGAFISVWEAIKASWDAEREAMGAPPEGCGWTGEAPCPKCGADSMCNDAPRRSRVWDKDV